MPVPTRILPLAGLALAIAPVLAAPVEIKLATIAPTNTSWHKALVDMGNTWNKDTQGRVTLQVYPDAADELTTIRKMRPGAETIQAAFLAPVGLAQLDDAFNVFSMPFFLETPEEEAAVTKGLTPLLDQRLQARGYHLLGWGTGGWVQVFSKKPLHSLADLKATKLYTSKGSDQWVRWYVANGFHPVALLPSDIPQQLRLSTGLIDTAPSSPYLAATLQIFRDARFMLDIHIAPLTGALIIANSSWNRISPDDQKKVTAAAAALERRVRAEAPGQDDQSITQMKARGLQVITLDARAAAEFRAAATQLATTMRGEMVPGEVYDIAVRERDAFRKSHGK